MTRDEALESTREALAAAEAQAAHLERLLPRVSADVGALADDEQAERAYALLHIFAQLHDVILSRLFRGAIVFVQEDPAALSVRALSLRLEKLGAIRDRQQWLDLSSLRNILVHDYPVGVATLARHVAAARERAPDLISALTHLGSFLRKEGLPE